MGSRFAYLSLILLVAGASRADQVTVRHVEGRVHGFVVLRDLEDRILGSGDLTQTSNGNKVTSELIVHFKDGSTHQETTVYSQRRTFQLLTYHLIQKGKAFKRSTDLSLNASTGQVTVRYSGDDGKEETVTERMKVPPDIANGLITILMNDIDPKTPKTTLSMVVSTPKPRLVKLEITPAGEDPFTIGGAARTALHFAIKIEIGGISGLIAPVIGKQPPDMQVWLAGGKAPGFLKLEGALYEGGPIWRIEMASPVWSR